MAKSTSGNTATAERQPTPEGEWVEEIPARSRKGVWEDRVALLRANPKRIMRYIGVSSSTVSHIKATYPDITATNRDVRKVETPDGKQSERADLYLVFDPEAQLQVEDEAEEEAYDEFAEAEPA